MTARVGSALRLGLALVAAAGLAIDAYVHFNLASDYAVVKSSVLSEADLFRIEGAVAAVAAGAVMLRPRRYTAAFAFLVAAAGTAAVLVYTYIDVGAFGPFPNMYENVWYPKKTLSAWAEGIAALAALALLVVLHVQARRTGRTSSAAVPAAATPHVAGRIGRR